jgi:hypothetical protein
MWQGISYVTGIFSLVAFIAAVVAAIVIAKEKSREAMIKYAPEEDQKDLIQAALEFFDVNPENLTKQQRFEIVIEQIRARARRFLISSVVCVVIAILLLSFFIIYKGQLAKPDIDENDKVMNTYINGIKKLKTGLARNKAIELFGQPSFSFQYQHLSFKEDIYSEHFGILRLVYSSKSDSLHSYCITKSSDSFNPTNENLSFFMGDGGLAMDSYENLQAGAETCEIFASPDNGSSNVKNFYYFESLSLAGYYGDSMLMGFYNLPAPYMPGIVWDPVPEWIDGDERIPEQEDLDLEEGLSAEKREEIYVSMNPYYYCEDYKVPRLFRKHEIPNTICVTEGWLGLKEVEIILSWPSKKKFFPFPYKPG